MWRQRSRRNPISISFGLIFKLITSKMDVSYLRLCLLTVVVVIGSGPIGVEAGDWSYPGESRAFLPKSLIERTNSH
jgi:hypothetical protein